MKDSLRENSGNDVCSDELSLRERVMQTRHVFDLLVIAAEVLSVANELLTNPERFLLVLFIALVMKIDRDNGAGS